ncbi:MAG: peptide ABC transporter permease [Tenericutes bacterium GWC2_39_45]|nr:MAG: peptide ABC transporter permease [Tenericutes bacterium GWC2_39_45]OHE31507.1 MAG: peptide ABC transporter permease [Tenericutes bacterium GWD2_38_27]OHE35253.1 MAG: peptide ABC transporter permease [Tenericutes bacterium GWE2_38_8]
MIMIYYLKRIISAIFTLFIIATLTFFMMRAIPGGPFTRERTLDPVIEARLLAQYNLDAPLMEQYFDYMNDLIHFDLGPSFQYKGYTVNDFIRVGFPISAKIGAIATLAIIIVGIPIGIISALKQNKPIDYTVMVLATLGVTIPSFIIATLYIYIFGYKLNWVPAGGMGDSPLYYIGPVIALSGYSLSFVARLTRSSMLEVIQQDYIRTARANGLSEFKVMGKHALKNGLIPVVTYIGPMIAAILTGSFVVEYVFGIAGIGERFVTSVTARDYTTVVGVTVFYAAFYIVMVLLVDIAYSFIDPRIKMGKKSGD